MKLIERGTRRNVWERTSPFRRITLGELASAVTIGPMCMSSNIFIRRFLNSPGTVGSLIPSSNALGEAFGYLASQLPIHEPIVELGAGTGSATQFLPDRTISLELDREFFEVLKNRFPERNIIHMNAIDYLASLDEPLNIISSIPLINNPQSREFKQTVRRLRKKGYVNNFFTFTYGLFSPLKTCGFERERRIRIILKNLPPAHIWHYR